MRHIMAATLIAFGAACACAAHADSDVDHHGDRDGRGFDRVPRVIDAQGKVVGPLASFWGRTGVFLKIDGALILVPIIHRPKDPSLPNGYLDTERSASEFQWAEANAPGYASTNCTGTPLVPQEGNTQDTSGPRPSVAIRKGADVTVYIAADTYSGVGVLRSYATSSGCYTEPPQDYTDPAWPAQEAYPITQHYPEPLRISY